MTQFFNTGLTQQQFLDQYWQKKPLVIRQAFADFESPISPDELAGMACEAEFESRLIQQFGKGDHWQLTSGPLAEQDFAGLPKTHWTLLVQDVDKHLPELTKLVQPFRFIPDWRRDDLMVSYAPTHGSVGPHTDGYDVFLLQAMGNRHWQVSAEPIVGAELVPGIDLQILAEFEYEHDWQLQAGDMLYLPPHFAHHGVALNDCMTFSIGFRAPKQVELLDALTNNLLEQGLAAQHYSDPDLQVCQNDSQINAQHIEKLRRLLHQTIDQADDVLLSTFGKLVTETKPSLVDLGSDYFSETMTVEEITEQFEQGHYLLKNGYYRFAWSIEDGTASLFMAGEHYADLQCKKSTLILLTELAKIDQIHWQQLCVDKPAEQLLCQLIADGGWYWQ